MICWRFLFKRIADQGNNLSLCHSDTKFQQPLSREIWSKRRADSTARHPTHGTSKDHPSERHNKKGSENTALRNSWHAHARLSSKLSRRSLEEVEALSNQGDARASLVAFCLERSLRNEVGQRAPTMQGRLSKKDTSLGRQNHRRQGSRQVGSSHRSMVQP